jgi:hypothetical protein
MSNSIKYLSLILLIVIVNSSFAQDDDNDGGLDEQTVIIYNEYTPVLKDANRLQFLPVIVDTIRVDPDFEYNVSPTLFPTTFYPSPITAASIKGEPLRPLDNGMFKLGVGNYLSPYVEAFYNSRRERHFSVGAFVKHHSAFGTIKNVADQKIFGGYNDNLVKAYGKKFLRSGTLFGELGFGSDQRYFYGYDPYLSVADGVVKPRDRAEMDMQRYNRIKADVGITSNNAAKNRVDYNAILSYQYFFAFTKDYQHNVDFDLDISKLVKSNRFGMDAGVVFNNNMVDTSLFNEVFLNLDPFFKHYTEDWQIKIGMKTTGVFIGDSTDYHLYPDLYLQHNISNTIIPYAGFKGYVQNNNFEYASTVNPFINRMSFVTPGERITNYAQVVDVGVKGNISTNLYFHINGNYSKIDDMAFYVNDTSLDLDNRFIPIFTNVERFSGYAEVALRNMEKFSFTLKGHYYHYSYIQNREKPWHMPTVDVSLRTNYQFDDKLNFGVDAGFIGTRYAKEYDASGLMVEKKLNPIIDFNLFAEYKFAHNFNAFIYLNNVTGQKQYIWNNYMSQGFNMMIGLKYLF